ncbi:hypothetical protein [uncultured Chryseobacterium sp.]|uniref:hypothetical protein n=1 Tax=uncultured Chryseobacterium sp. TaxID=259322 RepID=UPI0025ECB8F3|nr:hypothetical protein [uncultured Chryseobacterium sp.]
MVPIKHILNETGVSQIFKLVVPEGSFAGEYIMKTPDGWNEIDSIVSTDDENFSVTDFILGNSTKISVKQFTDPASFNLIQNVYNEARGDGRIIFKWIAEKNGVQYDLLKDNFEIDLNKFKTGFDSTKLKMDLEIKKREEQNKLSTREDVSVDLFAEKDLDDQDIAPVQTFEIGYKKGDKVLSNFYTYDISQPTTGQFETRYKNIFMSFVRSDDYELGDNTNKFASYLNTGGPLHSRTYQGPFIYSLIKLPNIKVEISNMNLYINKNSTQGANATLWAIFRVGETETRRKLIKSTTSEGQIKIDNEIFNIGDLMAGENLTFEVITNEDINIGYSPINENTSIKITSNLESPLVKTKGVRLIDGINQLVKNYTSGEMSVISNIIGIGGTYYNTSISTGMYLRGLPAIYFNQKIKTSLKNILADGAAKLMALGFDILDNKVVIEDIGYFFKDMKVYDLSERSYLSEDFSIEYDKDVVFNSMQFGSKKYSTNNKEDIRNFTTTAEFTTPIKSIKNKFDKETSLVIDEFRIQELIEDKTSSTNDNDDDLVMIDMVNLENHSDTGVFENCIHSVDGGNLLLTCNITPFDTTMISVGASIQIVEGFNAGNWTVLSIDGSKMKVNKTTGIQEGVIDTPIKYTIASLVKNRTSDGFTNPQFIRNFETATNIRHNPKYQMARWFPYFGSGLRKKLNTEKIKVTNYKNNSEAQMEINSAALANELPGLVVVGKDETLERLRNYAGTLFNGDKITITFLRVTFQEFVTIYENWRYGENNDRMKSRGYLTLNTPLGVYDVYPFGQDAFKHSKKTNQLTINGKVRGKSVDNPILKTVIQENKNTITLTWDYVIEYVNPVIKIQYSLDGYTWVTIHEVSNVKTATFSSDAFNSILTGETVEFRIIANSADYYNKISNSLNLIWQFNDWVLREVSRIENVNCGNSYLTFEFKGTGSFEITWKYEDSPGSGGYSVLDSETGTVIASYNSAAGLGEYDEQTTGFSIANQYRTFYIQLHNATLGGISDPPKQLNCNTGNQSIPVYSGLNIEIKDLANNDITSLMITAETTKKYFNRPPNPTPSGTI